jgi:hypothetical protein
MSAQPGHLKRRELHLAEGGTTHLLCPRNRILMLGVSTSCSTELLCPHDLLICKAAVIMHAISQFGDFTQKGVESQYSEDFLKQRQRV